MFDEYPDEEEPRSGINFSLILVLAALITLVLILVGAFSLGMFSSSVESPSGTAKSKDRPGRISGTNRVAAKNALNAIGEINSVASVGSNYLQYSNAVQSSKIKFDAALREIDNGTADDEQILSELTETFECYIDAKNAWDEFVQDGDEFGFLIPMGASKLPDFEKKYGFPAGKEGYYKPEVLGAILRRADDLFRAVGRKIQ